MRAASLGCSVVAAFTVLAVGAGAQTAAQDSRQPSALEQALIERTCRASVAFHEAHQQCLETQLLSLRADFGANLSRLSAADRQRLDSACSQLRPVEQRDAYLDCLSGQLTAVKNRRSRGKSAPSQEAAPSPTPAIAASDTPAAPAPQVSPRPSALFMTLIGGGGAAVLASAAVAFLVVKRRRARRICRECGAQVPDSGDLCPNCRREAAAALRRAAAERDQQQRAQEDAERRQREQEEEQRAQRLREQEEARLRQQELARQEEAAKRRREEERRRHDEEARQRAEAAATAEFDPYAVLGVPRDTTQEQIQQAYQQAKQKYDLDLITHLSPDVQELFKAKAQAVDRAYQMLCQ